MGGIFSALWGLLYEQEKEVKLALVGLDGAGKTTVIRRLLDDDFKGQTAPTIGIETQELKVRNITIKVFDLAGQENMRGVWKYYFSSTEGVIFIVDANRTDRFPDVKEELYNILNDENAGRIPILVYANKQDLPDSVTSDQLAEQLDCYETSRTNKDSLIHFQDCQCNTDDSSGLRDGFEWLTNKIVEMNLAKPAGSQ